MPFEFLYLISGRWAHNDDPRVHDIFTDKALRSAPFFIAVPPTSIALPDVLLRSLGFAIYLANTGYLEESRKASQYILDSAQKEGIDIGQMLPNDTWVRFHEFMGTPKTGNENSAKQENTNFKPWSYYDNTKLKRWREELIRGHSALERTTWRDRIDPVDQLRCAALYLSAPSASKEDVLEGIQALRSFISKTRNTPTLAYRRTQALEIAIDLSAQCSPSNEYSDAWQLALQSIEGTNYFFPSFESAFVLMPNFGPIFLNAVSQSQANQVELIRKYLHVDSTLAAAFPALLSQHVERQIHASRTAPLGKMTLWKLLEEYRAASHRRDAFGRNEEIVLRPAASTLAISETEKRIGVTLPTELKDLMRIANGWSTSSGSKIGHAFRNVEDFKEVYLKRPLPITGGRDKIYDPDSTFTAAIRIDMGPGTDTTIVEDETMLLIITDVNLKRARAADQGQKRVKGNDGSTVTHVKGDYRLVFTRPAHQPKYFSMIREYIEMCVKEHDNRVGRNGERDTGKRRLHYRKLSNNDPGNAAPSASFEDSDEGAQLGSGDTKPACWYGIDCRTKDHNANHAARYDHSGPNTRSR